MPAVDGRGATPKLHSLTFEVSREICRRRRQNVDQQSRSREEIAGEHADGLAVSLHGVQEEIPPSQRG